MYVEKGTVGCFGDDAFKINIKNVIAVFSGLFFINEFGFDRLIGFFGNNRFNGNDRFLNNKFFRSGVAENFVLKVKASSGHKAERAYGVVKIICVAVNAEHCGIAANGFCSRN